MSQKGFVSLFVLFIIIFLVITGVFYKKILIALKYPSNTLSESKITTNALSFEMNSAKDKIIYLSLKEYNSNQKELLVNLYDLKENKDSSLGTVKLAEQEQPWFSDLIVSKDDEFFIVLFSKIIRIKDYQLKGEINRTYYTEDEFCGKILKDWIAEKKSVETFEMKHPKNVFYIESENYVTYINCPEDKYTKDAFKKIDISYNIPTNQSNKFIYSDNLYIEQKETIPSWWCWDSCPPPATTVNYNKKIYRTEERVHYPNSYNIASAGGDIILLFGKDLLRLR